MLWITMYYNYVCASIYTAYGDTSDIETIYSVSPLPYAIFEVNNEYLKNEEIGPWIRKFKKMRR